MMIATIANRTLEFGEKRKNSKRQELHFDRSLKTAKRPFQWLKFKKNGAVVSGALVGLCGHLQEAYRPGREKSTGCRKRRDQAPLILEPHR